MSTAIQSTSARYAKAPAGCSEITNEPCTCRGTNAVEEILYFTNVANGAWLCWKCKRKIGHKYSLTFGSDGKFYHSECFDEKEMPK